MADQAIGGVCSVKIEGGIQALVSVTLGNSEHTLYVSLSPKDIATLNRCGLPKAIEILLKDELFADIVKDTERCELFLCIEHDVESRGNGYKKCKTVIIEYDGGN